MEIEEIRFYDGGDEVGKHLYWESCGDDLRD